MGSKDREGGYEWGERGIIPFDSFSEAMVHNVFWRGVSYGLTELVKVDTNQEFVPANLSEDGAF